MTSFGASCAYRIRSTDNSFLSAPAHRVAKATICPWHSTTATGNRCT
jgi:hypothetical protein